MTGAEAFALWIAGCLVAYVLFVVVPRGRKSDDLIGERVNEEIRRKWERTGNVRNISTARHTAWKPERRARQ